MFAKKVYQWNAVDVVRSNGEVHRGLVVDKQESHLLVDFDIGGKKPELVPFQNACLSNDYNVISGGLLNSGSTDDVVILMKLSKCQPWKWYTGKLLVRTYLFGVVKIRIGDEVITDCFRSEAVRTTAFSGKPLRKNDFVREECTVPDDFSYDTQSVALWRQRFPRTHPIGIVDNTFHFLQLRYEKDFDVNEMATALSDGILQEDDMETMKDTGNRGVKRPHGKIGSNEEAETSYITEDFSINDLPLDVIGVVFSFVDGRQQTRMRLVCSAWNSKILAPECSREMTVDLIRLYQEKNYQFILGAWLFHCITPWTKYVTITRSRTKPAALPEGTVLFILKKMMELKSPLSAVILHDMNLEPQHILAGSGTVISEDLQKVCSRMVFRDVWILDLFDAHKDLFSYARTNTFDNHLRIAFGFVNVGSQKELLDCFEAAATGFADLKHHDVLERVSKAVF